MDESCYINESVLLNYFAGELPADRRKEVEEWIAASEDNEKIFSGSTARQTHWTI